MLVYAVHTETRDVTPRLRAVLEGAGLRVAVLKAHTVKPEAREEWVARRVAEGLDVLIAPPRCVQTGLDLIEFPTIFWAEIEYSVYALRQASRRSWRLGQALPVEVYYAVYEGTLQAEALALVGRKLRAALLVEGDLPREGLATRDLDDGDLMLTLARRLADGEPEGGPPLERLFAESLALEARAGEALDAASWAETGIPAAPPEAPAEVPAGPGRRPAARGQLALLPPPAEHNAPRCATAADGGGVLGWPEAPRADPEGPPQERDSRPFVPAGGRVIPLDGLLGLTARPASPRRRKAPARDQLRLFG